MVPPHASLLLSMHCQQPMRWNLTDSPGPLHGVHVWVALQLAIQYAAAYHLSTEQTAEVLADSLLKGLLAAHHDSGGAIRDAWTAAGFREACEVCILAGNPYAAPVNMCTRRERFLWHSAVLDMCAEGFK